MPTTTDPHTREVLATSALDALAFLRSYYPRDNRGGAARVAHAYQAARLLPAPASHRPQVVATSTAREHFARLALAAARPHGVADQLAAAHATAALLYPTAHDAGLGAGLVAEVAHALDPAGVRSMLGRGTP